MERKFPLSSFQNLGLAGLMSFNIGGLIRWSSVGTKHSIKP